MSSSSLVSLKTPPTDFSVHEDDVATVRGLPTRDVQEWCDRRTQEYKAHIAILHSARNFLSADPDGSGADSIAVRDLISPHAFLEENVDDLVAMEPFDVGWWCKTKIEHYRTRIRGLRTLRNTAAPIHTLPQELLAEVFVHVPYIYRHPDGPAVRCVCRAWRQIIDLTPRFWANLLGGLWSIGMAGGSESSGERRARVWLKQGLERSGSVSFSLSLHGFTTSLAELILPHVHRISSLTIYLWSNIQIGRLESFCSNGNMTQLRALDIRHSANYYCQTRLASESFAAFPQLTSLRMTCVSLPTRPLLQSLRHFELTPNLYSWKISDSFERLILALAQLPQLETLTCCFDSLPNPSPPTVHIAHLPALRILSVDENVWRVPFLLSHLRLPDTVCVHLRLHRANTESQTLTKVASFVHAVRPDSVRMRLSFRQMVFHASRGEVQAVHVVVPSFIRYLRYARYSLLDIASCAEEIAELFRPVETVTKLEVLDPSNLGDLREAELTKVYSALLDGFPYAIDLTLSVPGEGISSLILAFEHAARVHPLGSLTVLLRAGSTSYGHQVLPAELQDSLARQLKGLVERVHVIAVPIQACN